MDQRQIWWAAGLGGGALVVGGVLLATLPGHKPAPLPIRARQYTQVRACLLTDQQGVTATADAPVWAGMQDGSAASHAQVSSLPVIGPATVPNAQSYANTLIQQKCSVVLAADPLPGQALRAVAAANPKVHFVLVDHGTSAGNLAVIDAASDVRASVAKAVEGAGAAS
ncbi:hypothetical protein P3T37_000748 [Kitasatospora sp. MAA4]|uniref:BMP family ABC transporter substrate-binding protein n=1 Tax=Kitasatospora sp. MAA4 TaxID=3035093 RepID=UPI00247570B0|nr:BMP family ABC transporter substrate-binding protein [Kitasatospora sp. MAA4]MDH6131379.1 hypothetical protein [Kitasatospora sp. MAA4]